MENGRIIKEARKATGLLQSEFAEYLEIPIRTLQQWEQGRRNMPDYVLRLILFKLEVDGLIKGFLKNMNEN
ncbi:MAG: helix-turn-helix domain-containing protein [Lachnospiraceae bacterium]|nr:helix-turn-helix domain-containing protein [Lachnospiraceae bacterium]